MSLNSVNKGTAAAPVQPLSRLAVTLLCTAGEVMQHEQQHLCVCYHCGMSSSPPSSLLLSVSKFVSVPSFCGSVLPFSGESYFVMLHMKCQCSRVQARKVGGVMSSTPPTPICSYSWGAFSALNPQLLLCSYCVAGWLYVMLSDHIVRQYTVHLNGDKNAPTDNRQSVS